MRGVEQEVRRLFDEVGVPMLDLDLPESFNRPVSWDLALGERVVMRLDLARRADDGAHRDARGRPEPRGPWWDPAGSGVSTCAATRRGAAARISKLSGIDSTLGLLT